MSSEQNVKSSSNKKVILIDLFSGAIAGAVAKTTIAPLDRAKINFQVSKAKFSYKKLIKFLKNDMKANGFWNLWRGNSATMVRVMPSAAINFTSHEQYKRLLRVDTDKNSQTPFLRFFAGSLAGLTAASFTYPLDVARARMAVTHKDQYINLTEIFKTTLKNEKISGLYRGFSVSLIGALPYAGSVYFVYESLKLHHKEKYKKSPNPVERIIFGAFAGIIGQTSSYPFDVLRRRIQTANVINIEEAHLSPKQLFHKIITEEGLIKGLYKGLSLNWIKGPIAAGIGFMTFDLLKIFTKNTLILPK